jgi:hypothetical protein
VPQSDRPVPLLRAEVAVLLVAGAILSVALAAGGGEKPKAAAPSPMASPTIDSPIGLTATAAVAPFAVTLSWSAPGADAEILGYEIFRDELEIAAVSADAKTYIDHNVFPGKTFTYEVVTRSHGTLESERVSTQVKVPTPVLSIARVSGTFNAKLNTLSQSGYIAPLGNFTVGWRFVPKCEQGACSVVWSDLRERTLKTTLRRKGGNYSGSDTGKFIGHCGKALGDTTVTVAFHVAKARARDGEWVATRLVGTLTEHHASQLGCTSGGASFNVTATLQT